MMGDTLDQREYFRDYRLTQKGKLLWDQIHMLHWYARELCLRYDYTCCSRMNAPHLPFHANLMIMKPQLLMLMVYMITMMWNKQKNLLLLWVLMKLNRCLKSENLDDAVYRPENFAILKYCYENYEFNADIDAFIEKVSAVQEEINILQ